VIFDGKPYSQEFWEEWTESMLLPNHLPGALDFLNHAREKGVDVFYVTNRKESERQATLQNLKETGSSFCRR
jgi:predicted secreted acid phosphatase